MLHDNGSRRLSTISITVLAIVSILLWDICTAQVVGSRLEPEKKSMGSFDGGISELVSTSKLVAVAAKKDSRIKIFDATTCDLVGEVEHGFSRLAEMALSPESDKLACTDKEGRAIRIFGLKDFKQIAVVTQLKKTTALAFIPATGQLAVADTDCVLSILNIPGGDTVYTRDLKQLLGQLWEKKNSTINKIVASPDGKYLAIVESQGSVLLTECRPDGDLKGHLNLPYKLTDVSFSKNGRYFCATGATYKVQISFSKDKDLSVSWSKYGGCLYLYDLATDKSSAASTDKMIPERTFWSADGQRLLVQAAVPPMKKGLPQSLFIFSRDEIAREKMTKAEARADVGKGPLLSSAEYCGESGVYFMESEEELIAWQIEQNAGMNTPPGGEVNIDK